MRQALGLNGFHQVINRVDLECIESKLAVGRNKDDSRRVFQVLKGIGQLNAGSLGHVDVKKHHVTGVFLELFNSLADAGGFSHDLGLIELAQ